MLVSGAMASGRICGLVELSLAIEKESYDIVGSILTWFYVW
jgi:hypothetical protein